MLTAFIGAGGGTALLLVMLFCLPAGQVIPIHGCIQLASNTSRIALFWHYMQWQIILRFIALMPVGVYIGLRTLWDVVTLWDTNHNRDGHSGNLIYQSAKAFE